MADQILSRDVEDEDDLAHHGVKGMKWGVRRDRPTFDVTNTITGKSIAVPYNPKNTTVTTDENGKVSATTSSRIEARRLDARVQQARVESRRASLGDLDNQQLRSLIERMNLERQYSQLIGPTPQEKKGNAAVSFSKKLLGDIGKEQVTRIAKAGVNIKIEQKLGGSANPFHQEIAAKLAGGGKKKK